MKNLKKRVERKAGHIKMSLLYLLKWLSCASITGVICGLTGSAFHKSVEYVTTLRIQYPFLIYFLPLGGLMIVGLYHLFNMSDDSGTNRIIDSIRNTKTIPFRMAPLIFVSTVITHLLGGSSGREGAALQIGGSIGSTLGNIFRLDEKDIHIITMCGMSGVFAALFGTPVTATIFSMEVISVGVLYYVAFIPCLLSAILAFDIAKYFGMKPIVYHLSSIPEADVLTILRVLFLAALCAVVSMVFCFTLHKTSNWYKKLLPNAYLRVLAGGFLVAALTFLLQTHDYNGTGMEIVSKALAGNAAPEAFLLKMLFTALTLGAGFKGGEIVPSFFIGATFGNIAGGLLGLSPSFGAAIGLISMFCGVVNCPIASLLLSLELFGVQGLMLFCLACAVSYALSGYYGLYSSQKIVYSKLSPTYINKNTY